MRAKTILIVLFLGSLAIVAVAFTHTQKSATTEPKEHILAATMPLAAGTLLRAQDVTWHAVSETEPDQIARPTAIALEAKPELDDETRASVYGAVLRQALAAGEPIRLGVFVKPGAREFLQVVLSPGDRAIAIPVTTGGASTGLLSPGDRVDVILTQNFSKNDTANNEELRHTALTRRSVSETVVENLRVLAIDALDNKPATATNGGFGRTVTLEVTPEQVERINVATELGKLTVALRSVTGPTTLAAVSPTVKPTWAGDVSPALSGAVQEKPSALSRAPVQVFHGRTTETVKTD
jgi:pilus assembly protein CpaB